MERRQDGRLLLVALGHQSAAAPAGLLAHPLGPGSSGTWPGIPAGAATVDRPGPRLPQQHADASAEPSIPESGRAGARAILQAGNALAVVAVDPAVNRAGIVLEEGGDLGRGEAAQGEPDHHQAQGEAPGALQQGHDLAFAIGGRLGKDVGRTQELDVASLDVVEDAQRGYFRSDPAPPSRRPA